MNAELQSPLYAACLFYQYEKVIENKLLWEKYFSKKKSNISENLEIMDSVEVLS